MNTKLFSHQFGWLDVLTIFSIVSLVFFFMLAGISGVLRADRDEDRERCLSNLKQIALGLKQYALDWDETLPWGSIELPEIDKRIMQFKDDELNFEKFELHPFQSFGLLHPSYAFSLEIFRCPSSRDVKWDEKKAHLNNKDHKPFVYGSCKDSLSYAYGFNKDGNGKGIKGPWTEADPSTTRIVSDKYTCADYSKGDIKNKPGNHDAQGRNYAYLDGSAEWDDAKTPLDADPFKKYPETSKTPESDQTGADWWSDPPDKK